MPQVIRRPPRSAAKIVGVISAAALALAAPAGASAACPTAPTIKAFSIFGDNSDYSLAPAGAFESGATGWALSGASVVAGSESYRVHGAADAKSLNIAPGGTAVSPAFCVDVAHPTFRFFAKRTSGTWANLAARIRWVSNGATVTTDVGTVGPGTSWGPSQIMQLSGSLPLSASTPTIPVQFVFTPQASGGAVAVDDIYIDPYGRG